MIFRGKRKLLISCKGEHNMKKKLYLHLAGLLAVAFLAAASAGETFAASNAPAKLKAGTLWLGDEVYGGVDYETVRDGVKLVSVKSSKPSVIRAMKDSDSNEFYANTIMPVKLGKSKITVTYKYKGKKYTTSATYTVKKYPNPFKSIKVNGNKIDLKANRYSYNVEKFKKSRVKVQFSLASGWKLTRGYTYGKDYSLVPVKNGSTVKVPKGDEWTCIFLEVTNRKGETMQYSLRFRR